LNVRPVITHRVSYTEFAKAFDIMEGGQSGKIVMDWTR
jgi:threonine 3-dehydrogenase